MALRIEGVEIERLVAEVAELSGVTKAEAIQRALEDRKEFLTRMRLKKRTEGLEEWLAREVWPNIRPEFRAKPIKKEDYDALNDE
jgi:antitoxin VapB